MANRLLCLSTTFLNPLDCQLFNAFQYRGLKRWQLLKSRKGKKALPKTRKRDGKTYTVDHLYWERYFSNAPQVLLERQAVNTKSVSQLKPKVSSPARLYETFTKADKRLIYAGLFGLTSGIIAWKIINY
nr:uncharacterized protein LOC101239792 [Hydra vulgaris]